MIFRLRKFNRHFAIALTGAVFLLSPASMALASSNIDTMSTGSIGSGVVTSGPIQGSRSFRNALSLLDEQKYADAYQVARGFANAIERRTVQWAAIYSGGGDVDFASVLRFANDAPQFASARLYRLRKEQAIVAANSSTGVVIENLGGSMPASIDGQIVLATAYLRDGQRARAIGIAREVWTKNFLTIEQETALRGPFASLLTNQDHWKRAVHLLMNDRAKGTERIMSLLTPAQKSLALARIAVARKQSNADALLDRVDPAFRDHPLFYFSRGQFARRAGNLVSAVQFLNRAKGALPDASEWWYERRYLARKLLAAGDPRNAYNAVANYGPGPDGRVVDANFHAGWIALSFLNDAQTAVVHFQKMRSLSTVSSSITQSNYWLGRALSKLGDTQGASTAFNNAAQYPMTYYGQLSRFRLGMTDVEMREMPGTGGIDPQFNARQLVQGVKLLAGNDQNKLAETLLGRLIYQLTDPGEMLLAARLAQQIDAHQLAILMADVANRKGIALDLFNYPRDGIPTGIRLADIDMAAIYAVARQESRFDIDAISSSGARGIMQLMPATAKETAQRLGLSYSASRLTSDPAYNALLGSTYLGAQLSRFDGSLILAAGAYNAGAGNVNKWVSSFGDPSTAAVDPVVWIELIPFSETRNYVQRVVANYMFYRARQAGEDPNIAQVLRRIPAS